MNTTVGQSGAVMAQFSGCNVVDIIAIQTRSACQREDHEYDTIRKYTTTINDEMKQWIVRCIKSRSRSAGIEFGFNHNDVAYH